MKAIVERKIGTEGRAIQVAWLVGACFWLWGSETLYPSQWHRVAKGLTGSFASMPTETTVGVAPADLQHPFDASHFGPADCRVDDQALFAFPVLPSGPMHAGAPTPVALGYAVVPESLSWQVSRLELAVTLRKVGEPDLDRGLIWAVAEFVDRDGRLKIVTSPPNLALQSEGMPVAPQKSYRFAIKTLKVRHFAFDLSGIGRASLRSLRIGLATSDLNRSTRVEIPPQI